MDALNLLEDCRRIYQVKYRLSSILVIIRKMLIKERPFFGFVVEVKYRVKVCFPYF